MPENKTKKSKRMAMILLIGMVLGIIF